MFINVHTHSVSNSGLEILNSDSIPPVSGFYSLGIHPHQSDSNTVSLITLKSNAQNNNCLAIGEIGLDKLISIPLARQTDLFQKQIAIAEALQLPILIHCVKAWNEIQNIKRAIQPLQPWIFHGFRKTTLLQSVLNEGLIISVGTAVLYDQQLQNIIANIPDNMLLLETDGDTEHTIEEVYQKIAELKNISQELLEVQIEQNFNRIFRKAVK